ncbi:MAG: acyltransferase [Rhizomicrobium sp.]
MAGRKFEMLDGLRGVAALAVLLYHLPHPLHRLAPHGYLAVDLFFLMSGFVVAGAYEERLRSGGLTAGAFLLVRLKRLWPLYALGLVLGVAMFLALRWLRPDAGFAFPAMPVAVAALLSLLFLPQFAAYGGPAFPFNSAAWSLSVELAGNLAYAVLARRLRTGLLAILCLTGLGGLILIAARTGGLDVGVAPTSLAGGYVRFLFSFPLGVLLWRLHAAGKLPLFRVPPLLLLAAAGAAFAGALPDTVAVALLFPLLAIAARCPVTSPGLARGFAWAGAVSYPLYVLHRPLVDALYVLDGRIFGALAVLAGAVAAAAAAERWFDRPIRSLIRQAGANVGIPWKRAQFTKVL